MVLPQSVDHHAGNERMLGTRDPFGQLQPAASLRDRRLIVPSQDARKTPRHFSGLPVVTAANMNFRVVNSRIDAVGTAPLLQCVTIRRFLRFLFNRLDLVARGLERYLIG